MSILLRIATRGLGGPAGTIITQGFGPVALSLIRIVRGGRSAASRLKKDLEYQYESFKIAAMLLQVNGKEIVNPIIKNVRKTFNEGVKLTVSILPKKLVARKADNIKITIGNIKIRNKNDDD